MTIGDFFGVCLLIFIGVWFVVGLKLTLNYYNLNDGTWHCTDGYYTEAQPPHDKDYVCTQYSLKKRQS